MYKRQEARGKKTINIKKHTRKEKSKHQTSITYVEKKMLPASTDLLLFWMHALNVLKKRRTCMRPVQEKYNLTIYLGNIYYLQKENTLFMDAKQWEANGNNAWKTVIAQRHFQDSNQRSTGRHLHNNLSSFGAI